MSTPSLGSSALPGVISLRRIPRWVWLVAVAVAVGRMVPYAVAEWRTPPGWTFTGNLSLSPDYMQYRTWSRQTQDEGVVVTNRFTAEANRPFLPVPLYWSIGQLSRVTGMTPEWVYAWLGVPFAIALVVLLFAITRRFLAPVVAVRWTLATLILGGGLGAVLLYIRETPALASWHPFYLLVVEPMSGPARAVPFEGFRGNYVVTALFDTHFLTYWVAALVAVMGLTNAVLDWSRRRMLVLAVLFAAATLLHVYEGITLLAISAGVVVAATRRGFPWQRGAAVLLAGGIAVAACLGWVFLLHQRSGLPAPTWRGLALPPMIVLLAFPVTWLLVAVGGGRWWREGRLEAAVLLGWAGGCLAIVLSGPFFPYPDRGTMTLQVPMLLIAAAIYFRDRLQVRPLHAALLVLLAGSSLAWQVRRVRRDQFKPDEPYQWVSESHQRVIALLADHGRPSDLLVADEAALRWLGPEYVGRHHAGHFFLTVNYEAKRDALERFLQSDDHAAQARFLRETGATWLFVPPAHDPARFGTLPGVTPAISEPVGTLFRVDTALLASTASPARPSAQ